MLLVLVRARPANSLAGAILMRADGEQDFAFTPALFLVIIDDPSKQDLAANLDHSPISLQLINPSLARQNN